MAGFTSGATKSVVSISLAGAFLAASKKALTVLLTSLRGAKDERGRSDLFWHEDGISSRLGCFDQPGEQQTQAERSQPWRDPADCGAKSDEARARGKMVASGAGKADAGRQRKQLQPQEKAQTQPMKQEASEGEKAGVLQTVDPMPNVASGETPEWTPFDERLLKMHSAFHSVRLRSEEQAPGSEARRKTLSTGRNGSKQPAGQRSSDGHDEAAIEEVSEGRRKYVCVEWGAEECQQIGLGTAMIPDRFPWCSKRYLMLGDFPGVQKVSDLFTRTTIMVAFVREPSLAISIMMFHITAHKAAHCIHARLAPVTSLPSSTTEFIVTVDGDRVSSPRACGSRWLRGWGAS
ncbi:hypothetical protein BDK51DRAFT_47178 [Blyttiomyces helicus]|uniref:Uncharacterized protein n=1 Tax=Blyttiomyces helicus TaxID=388810 RepID=A0A4P9W3D3_9FUNG|nr:hypothetical protein BDK51DRAFT_47178 [Blyttiomyces helicus]|eukprot:RKO85160.1 hypothetical protein BDK51DRAFT_47178 [Blyttiomyces helicus]